MKFDILRCAVALGGDVRQIVHVGETGDVTWPEVVILRAIHGEHAVTQIVVTGEADLNPDIERERLTRKYVSAPVGQIFPGYAAQLPAIAPDYVPRYDDEVETVVVRKKKKAEPEAAKPVRQRAKRTLKPKTQAAEVHPAAAE